MLCFFNVWCECILFCAPFHGIIIEEEIAAGAANEKKGNKDQGEGSVWNLHWCWLKNVAKIVQRFKGAGNDPENEDKNENQNNKNLPRVEIEVTFELQKDHGIRY